MPSMASRAPTRVRPSRFRPDRLIRVLQEYTGREGEYAWEVVAEAYAMRRDKRGSARDDGDDATHYDKVVTFVLPRTIRFTPRPPAGADGKEAFGRREFGELPMGGRGRQSGERIVARGAQVEPGHAIQDTGVHGGPIFLVTDIFELPDRKRVEVTCMRSDREGTIYGD